MGKGSLSTTVARYNGGKISVYDLQTAQREIKTLTEIDPGIFQLLDLDRTATADHWIILSDLANRAGLMGGGADGLALLERYATESVTGNRNANPATMSDDVQKRIAELKQNRNNAINHGASEAFVDHVLAKASGIQRLRALNSNLQPALSLSEAELAALNSLDSASVDIAYLPATAAVSADSKPDEARLQAHFEKYKNTKKGEGELGIGYLRPAGVQLEWLSINRVAIAATVNVDLMELNRFWRSNKTKYGEDFAVARMAAETDYRAQEAGKLVDKAEEALRKEIYRSTMSFPSDGHYKTFPADWATKMPTMEQLATVVSASIGGEKPERFVNVVHSDNKFRILPELQALAGIGASTGTFGDMTNVSLAQAVLSVHELMPDSRVYTQLDQVYGPMVDYTRSNDYYFRVLAVRPQSPPDNLDEIRAQVVSDVALLDAFADLESRKSEYLSKLNQAGIAGVSTSVGGVHVATGVNANRSQLTPSEGRELTVPEANTEGIRAAIMDRVGSWDPKVDVKDQPAEQRRLVLVDPKAKGLVMIEITGRHPVHREMLTSNDMALQQIAQQQNYTIYRNVLMPPGSEKKSQDQRLKDILAMDPLGMPNLSIRLNFEQLGRTAKEDEEKKAAETPKSDAPQPDTTKKAG